jgi:copper chaperone CopZ
MDATMTRFDRLSPYLRRGLMVALVAPLLLFAGLPGQVFEAGASAAVTEPKSSLRTVEIPVEGMACFSCAGTIKNAVKSMAGVLRVEVSLERRSARVTYFGDGHIPQQVVAAIDKLGYKAGTPKDLP